MISSAIIHAVLANFFIIMVHVFQLVLLYLLGITMDQICFVISHVKQMNIFTRMDPVWAFVLLFIFYGDMEMINTAIILALWDNFFIVMDHAKLHAILITISVPTVS